MAEKSIVELTPEQQLAVEYLFRESVEDVAKRLQIKESMIRWWMTIPVFKAEFHKYEFTVIQASLARLVGLLPTTINVFVEIMQSKTVIPSTRLKAAHLLLSWLVEFHDRYSLEERTAMLEAKVIDV